MRKASTVILSGITLLLIIAIGVGGWVLFNKRPAQEGSSNNKPEQSKIFTLDEVSQHNSKSDCWTVISGDVYDLTDFVDRHPGGDEILRACGTDATILFNSRKTTEGQPVGSGTPHSQNAQEQLAKLKIGTTRKN